MKTPDQTLLIALAIIGISLYFPAFTASGPVIPSDGEFTNQVAVIDTGGVIFLGAALLAGALRTSWRWGRAGSVSVGLCGLFLTVVSLGLITNPSSYYEDPTDVQAELIEPGLGLVLIFIGGLLLLISAYNGYKQTPQDGDA